jgi:hypothetical protein
MPHWMNSKGKVIGYCNEQIIAKFRNCSYSCNSFQRNNYIERV